jgi:hypothetical protein
LGISLLSNAEVMIIHQFSEVEKQKKRQTHEKKGITVEGYPRIQRDFSKEWLLDDMFTFDTLWQTYKKLWKNHHFQ